MNNKKGFTLLEVLIALLIFSISSGTLMLMVSQSNSFIRKGSEYEYVINKYNKFQSELLTTGNFEEEINADDYRYEISDLEETIFVNGMEVTVSSPNHKEMKITILKGENKYILERIISAEK